ncbi:hypothetical protein U4E84_08305 [Halorubrum sp. AD140]|uniref:hypothetical protein n=1 Tax=Halorubrum sp. AD140 TaxID=3050073 RepID=UPI002ACC8E1E|nr:hypothetical protein [Halorubrum sp. AD140]MDZ5811349.1 hypothetical protein [Halorubrum sp. AD140]
MTQKDTHLTRREALAGVGAVGFATLGAAGGRSTGSWDDYSDYTYAQSDTPWNVVVGWRRTENGSVVDASPTDAVADAGPDVRLVDLDNALPGDSGTASVGLRLDDPAELVPEGVRVWLRLVPRVGSDPASAALAERVSIDLRYDTGILGIGGCAGAGSSFAAYGERIAAGTLASFDGGALASGVELTPGLLGGGCLAPGERRCLAFAWEFDADGGNAGQGGTVDFDLSFAAVACGDEANPFLTAAVDDAGGQP